MKKINKKKLGKRRGETLLESIISMFFTVSVIVPVSNLILKTYSLNSEIDNENKIMNENKNMTELIKTKTYEEIKTLEGMYSVDDVNDFYQRFYIEKKYHILEESREKKRRDAYIKKTYDYYINNDGNREYIYYINIGGAGDYYFPDIK